MLSEGPFEEFLDLGTINYAITNGDCSGRVTYRKPEVLTKREMALALQEQASDPTFLLGDEGWVYGLQPGDEVNWTDPDNGECSRIVTIKSIEFPTDEVFRIETAQGDVIEGFVEELS